MGPAAPPLDKLRDEVVTLILYRRLWRLLITTGQEAHVPPSYMFTFLADFMQPGKRWRSA